MTDRTSRVRALLLVPLTAPTQPAGSPAPSDAGTDVREIQPVPDRALSA